MSFGRKIISAITVAFAMLALTTFVAAQNPKSGKQTDKAQKQRKFERKNFGERGFHRGMRGKSGLRGLHHLNLSDAQKEQIRGIMEAGKIANEPLRQEMRTIFEKRRSGAELSEADKARLQEIHTRMKQSNEQAHNTILSILTVEQRQQLEQWKQERQKRMEERRQKMKERRQEMEKRRSQQTPRSIT